MGDIERPAMILPGCLAVVPAEEVLELACVLGRCTVCEGPACAEHERCGGCDRVICADCDTEGGMAVTRFAGDRLAHPHNERAT